MPGLVCITYTLIKEGGEEGERGREGGEGGREGGGFWLMATYRHSQCTITELGNLSTTI